jgi:hypothetical protein
MMFAVTFLALLALALPLPAATGLQAAKATAPECCCEDCAATHHDEAGCPCAGLATCSAAQPAVLPRSVHLIALPPATEDWPAFNLSFATRLETPPSPPPRSFV